MTRLVGDAARPPPATAGGARDDALMAVFCADMLRHTIFGIEVDVATLLSPSHLVLAGAVGWLLSRLVGPPAAPGGPVRDAAREFHGAERHHA